MMFFCEVPCVVFRKMASKRGTCFQMQTIAFLHKMDGDAGKIPLAIIVELSY